MKINSNAKDVEVGDKVLAPAYPSDRDPKKKFWVEAEVAAIQTIGGTIRKSDGKKVGWQRYRVKTKHGGDYWTRHVEKLDGQE